MRDAVFGQRIEVGKTARYEGVKRADGVVVASLIRVRLGMGPIVP